MNPNIVSIREQRKQNIVNTVLKSKTIAEVSIEFGVSITRIKTYLKEKGLIKTVTRAERSAIHDKKAKLMVSVTEIPAKKLYESVGFQEVGTTDWILGDGKKHQLYIMEKEI